MLFNSPVHLLLKRKAKIRYCCCRLAVFGERRKFPIFHCLHYCGGQHRISSYYLHVRHLAALGDLDLYFDVQNVTNRENVEGVTYNTNYSMRSYTTGLPVFPSIGVEYVP